jgi:hypothetical protein
MLLERLLHNAEAYLTWIDNYGESRRRRISGISDAFSGWLRNGQPKACLVPVSFLLPDIAPDRKIGESPTIGMVKTVPVRRSAELALETIFRRVRAAGPCGVSSDPLLLLAH